MTNISRLKLRFHFGKVYLQQNFLAMNMYNEKIWKLFVLMNIPYLQNFLIIFYMYLTL